MKLYGRSHYALDPYAVAPHYDRHFLTFLIEHSRAHRNRIFRAELEDVTYLKSLEDFERARFALRAAFARCDCPEINPAVNRNVARDVDAAQMVVILIRAGRHVAA